MKTNKTIGNIGWIKLVGLIFISIILFAQVTQAATYYVRTDGNDSNAGTTNSAGGAWLSIDHAADTVSAGDVVRVQAGTYNESITFGHSGSGVNSTITFVADGTVTINGTLTFSNSSYIRVIGFIIDAYDAINYIGTNTGIELWHNTVYADRDGVRCTPGSPRPNEYNFNHQGVIVGNHFIGTGATGSGYGIRHCGDNSLIAYNEVENISCDGICLKGDGYIHRNNYIHGLTGDGGHPDFFQYGSSTPGFHNATIEYNFGVHSGNQDEHIGQVSNTYAGCEAVDENVWRCNVFHDGGGYGVGHGTPQATYGITGQRFYHNTFVNTARSAPSAAWPRAIALAGTTGVDNIHVFNNIFHETWGADVTSGMTPYAVGSGSLSADYNLSYDPDGRVSFGSPYSREAHRLANVDPQFSNYASDDFTLRSGSSAVGYGTYLTQTIGSGTGTSFSVSDAGFFRGDNTNLSQYGGGLVVGDQITVGTDTVRIASISGNTITVTESFTWANGENVYYGTDTTPDLGAYPYKAGGYTLSATYSKVGDTVTVAPNEADLVRMVVVFEDGIPIGADSISPFSVSGVGNGTLSVRAYPFYASSTLYIEVTPGEGVPVPSPPRNLDKVD